GGAEILDRHARRDHRALAAQVGIGARHVVHDADLDGAVGVLRLRPGAPEGDCERRDTDEPFHRRFSATKVPYFGLGSNPQIVMELFGPEMFYRALPCGDDRLFALNYRGNTTQRRVSCG